LQTDYIISSDIVYGLYILEAIIIGYETFFQDTIILENGYLFRLYIYIFGIFIITFLSILANK